MRTHKILKYLLLGTAFLLIIFALIFGYLIGVWGHPAINKPSENQLEKSIFLTACYEGTQSQTIINFRTDSTFDLNATAAFGYDKWWQGRWSQKGDTLSLKYQNEVDETIGNSLKLTDNELISLETGKNRVFLIGKCKNQN
jgi:hypothetical protein